MPTIVTCHVKEVASSIADRLKEGKSISIIMADKFMYNTTSKLRLIIITDYELS